MDLIARRKLRETWREAVEARSGAAGISQTCLARFDEFVSAGIPEGEAAYLVLRRAELLWPLSSGRDRPAATGDPES